MEVKKYPRVDLERYHNFFVEIGLILALGICFIAFEWKSPVKEVRDLGGVAVQEIETEIIPITRQEQVRPPEPPPPPKVVEVLNIVSNDVEIDKELEIEDTEADEATVVEVSPIVTTVEHAVEEEEKEDPIFYIVENMPEFPGGQLALRKFIADAIKYPVIAQENGIQGKVYVNFVVGKDGQVTNARVIRSVDPALDKEALRVVNSLPRWKPGMQQGEPVRVAFSVPISFVLQ
ncbi:energy transducer TonB [Mangrovibacterium lignilyticum]|uniref:energy transducer TonB n=1 Tax=Mangrovibacterium lignilyticum TaxID=2668052 RepID=UPI0013D35A21|nr:energy transducer TonB [Mangrovibacterium lignilyticum]